MSRRAQPPAAVETSVTLRRPPDAGRTARGAEVIPDAASRRTPQHTPRVMTLEFISYYLLYRS